MTEIAISVGLYTAIVMLLMVLIVQAKKRLIPSGDVTIKVNGQKDIIAKPGGKLLGALSKYPQTGEYEDERTSATLQLMAYLLKTRRSNMYRRYTFNLCAIHVGMGSYAEAARTILLQADALGPWDTTVVCVWL